MRVKPVGRERERQRRRSAEDRGAEVDAVHVPQHPRYQHQLVEGVGVASERDLVLGTTVDVVEHGPRQSPPGHAAQIGDALAAGEAAALGRRIGRRGRRSAAISAGFMPARPGEASRRRRVRLGVAAADSTGTVVVDVVVVGSAATTTGTAAAPLVPTVVLVTSGSATCGRVERVVRAVGRGAGARPAPTASHAAVKTTTKTPTP